MSLSFVSKSVQTSTEDGQFVEHAIEGGPDAKDDSSGTARAKPLFEQLQANKDQADAEQEEYQRAMMRGTLALDEEDAAHLDLLRRKQAEQEAELRRRTQEEVAAFYAARADRSEGGSNHNDDNDTNHIESNESLLEEDSRLVKISMVAAAKPKLAPQITIKRKRKKDAESNDSSLDKKHRPTSGDSNNKSTSSEKNPKGLGSLLAGYGSSSDEEEG